MKMMEERDLKDMGVDVGWVKEPQSDVRTRKTPTTVGVKKPDATCTATPHGHGDARQALSELRRIVDAERHRIRRKLIRVRHKIRRDENRMNQLNRTRRERSGDLVTDALAAVAIAGLLIFRRGLAMLHLRLLLLCAAIVEKIEPVSRDHEQGDDGDE